MDALDILSNNLANLNTAGYKEEKTFFTLLRQEIGESAAEEIDTVIDRQKVLALSSLNPANGSLALTNRDLDVALSGGGFLTVETPQGVRYTRNGSLSLSSKSELTTADGFPVLGEGGHSISLGPGKIRINDDGEVFLNDARVDRLKIVNFDNHSVLVREGGSLLSSKGGQEKPADAKIKQGYLEQSNVNPVSAVISMVGILRQFEATQKSVNILMNDLNQKSIERLGR
jgi:flagellar basal-body rod protein FlgG